MGQDSKGEDWEDNSRHAGDAVGSMEASKLGSVERLGLSF